MPRLAAAVLLGALAVGVTAAQAKDFRPGDLRVCNAKRCVAIVNPEVVAELGPFYYYGRPRPRVAMAPRIGAHAFELRFRNGYPTGIAATARLDRFLSYGVNLERFRRGRWYRLPHAVSVELRRLTAGLAPLRVTRDTFARSR
jgi:hypothetical protein